MGFKYREVVRSIQSKTPVPEGKWRSGKERSAPIIIEDVFISRVTIPKEKGGSKDIPPGTLNSIRKQLLLCKAQFVDFISCTMTKPEYVRKMKAKFSNSLTSTPTRKR